MRIFQRVIVLEIMAMLILTGIVLLNEEEVQAIQTIGGPIPWDASPEVTLSGDWQVTADIEIVAGRTVYFDPGTRFYFPIAGGNKYEIVVKGTLVTQGSQSEKVHFWSDRGTLQPNDWKGFTIESTGHAVFKWTSIESADTAIKVKGASPILEHTEIFSANTGIDAEANSFPKLYNVTFENCGDRDIKLFKKL